MPISKLKITRHLAKDPVFQPLIEEIPFPKLNATPTPLSNALIESIVYQQLSIKAAATIYKRLLDKFENEKLDLKKLTHMKTETLRGLGLSYSKQIMFAILHGFFWKRKTRTSTGMGYEDDLVKKLTVIKGVGTWTVQMTMISPMGKLDVFPALDLGVQQGIVRLYHLEETGKPLVQKMHSIAEQWRPYRTIACMYLWRWKDQFRK
ncbi:MAG: DNA-3-methyladenine glycosylase 2 family protein [Saprospiraceae bacterium]|nr:DNA-3-methyladenine glycosylase 2 family protein [Saprospiraceae bacterium]